jgi:hypothetical protein
MATDSAISSLPARLATMEQGWDDALNIIESELK